MARKVVTSMATRLHGRVVQGGARNLLALPLAAPTGNVPSVKGGLSGTRPPRATGSHGGGIKGFVCAWVPCPVSTDIKVSIYISTG